MFKIGDKIKANMATAELQYGEWKGSDVYTKMMQAAYEKRFEVSGISASDYIITRLEDKAILTASKGEAHTLFVLANDEEEVKKEE